MLKICILINLKISIKKYWTPKLNVNNDQNLKEIIKNTKERLLRSIELRKRSDVVPIALSLSGMNSSLIASIIKKEFNQNIDTFSIIDSDSRYDERINIDILKKDLKCKNTQINLSEKKNNFFLDLKKLVEYHDAPISTISSYVEGFIHQTIFK